MKQKKRKSIAPVQKSNYYGNNNEHKNQINFSSEFFNKRKNKQIEIPFFSQTTQSPFFKSNLTEHSILDVRTNQKNRTSYSKISSSYSPSLTITFPLFKEQADYVRIKGPFDTDEKVNLEDHSFIDPIVLGPEYKNGSYTLTLYSKNGHVFYGGRIPKIDGLKSEIWIETAESMENEYRELVAEGKKMEAIEYLIDKYNYPAEKADISIDMAMTGAIATTGGKKANGRCDIAIGPTVFETSTNFGLIVRALDHEFLHVDQKTRENPLTTNNPLEMKAFHNEREFIAYHRTLTSTSMPENTSVDYIKTFIWKAEDYYRRLSTAKQTEYGSMKADIDELKLKYP